VLRRDARAKWNLGFTGKFADKPTRASQFVDWLTSGLDDLQISQLADSKFLIVTFRTIICYKKFFVKHFGELTSPRVVSPEIV